MKRLQVLRGYLAKHVKWLLALLLIMVLIQPDASYRNGRVVITLGPPEAYAAGTADYSLDGLADDVEIQTALNALPNQGGLLHFKAGTYNLTANVTRAIGNVTIEGEGRNTLFTGSGSFVAGGNQWVFRDMALNATTQVDMGATTGWEWTNVYDQATLWNSRVQSGQVVFVTANGTTLFVTSLNGTTLNATQLTATTGNFTTAFITLGNITSANISSLNSSNIYHTDIYGHNYKIFSSGGVPTGYGYVSAFYFGENNGNTTSNASFQGAFGINNLQHSDNLTEGNWAFGDAIMQNGTALRYNIGIGDGTLRWLTTSNYTVAVGDHIGYAVGSISNSAILGSEAARNLSSGSQVVVIGRNAAYTATTLTNDIIIGTSAAYFATISNGNNVIIGHAAAAADTFIGTANTLLGHNAGLNMTSANYTTAIGRGAGIALRTGNYNTLIGYLAGRFITTGGSNVFLGYQAGDSIITGSSNIHIGPNAGAGIGDVSTSFALGQRGGTFVTEYLTGQMNANPTTLNLNSIGAAGVQGAARNTRFTMTNYFNPGSGSASLNFSILNAITNETIPSSNISFSTNGTTWLIGENINGTVGVFISSNGTMKKVYEGAANTGGTGYKTLIVPN